MIMTVTTRITRRYLENKTKSDLAQMYLDLLDADIKLESTAKAMLADVDYSEECPTGYCVVSAKLVHELRKVIGITDENVPEWAKA